MNALLHILRGFIILLAFALAGGPAWSGDTGKVKVKSAGGEVLVVFKRDGDRVKIEDGGGNLLLKGKPRDDGGRKYKGPYEDARYKITESDDGFKVKTETGSLLWKLKRYDRRITIADNDEGVMKDALRQTKPDKWVLEWDGQEQGKIKRYADKNKLKVKDKGGRELYVVKDQPLSPMYGVLLMTRIPREEAYVIMAEMWLRGW